MGKSPADLTGRRFGRLTAMERLAEKKGSSYLWRSRCDCGREVEVLARSLLSGNTKSCGCARQETLRERSRDIRGQRFGLLTAREPLDRRVHRSVVWLCDCACGKQAEYSYNELMYCGVKSCGCEQHPSKPLELHYIDGTCVELLERRLRRDNTSGYTGVVKTKKGWRARIYFKGKCYHLGVYSEIRDAARVRRRAEQELHGAFLDWYQAEQEWRAGEKRRMARPAASVAGPEAQA